MQHVASLTVQAIDSEVEDVANLDADEAKGKEQQIGKLLALRRLWRKSGKILQLEAIEDAEGASHSQPDRAAQLLKEHWAPIFSAPEGAMAGSDFEKFVPFIQKIPESSKHRWTMSLLDVELLLTRLKASAPGPDGVPYGAWQAVAPTAAPLLFQAYEALLKGCPLQATSTRA